MHPVLFASSTLRSILLATPLTDSSSREAPSFPPIWHYLVCRLNPLVCSLLVVTPHPPLGYQLATLPMSSPPLSRAPSPTPGCSSRRVPWWRCGRSCGWHVGINPAPRVGHCILQTGLRNPQAVLDFFVFPLLRFFVFVFFQVKVMFLSRDVLG